LDSNELRNYIVYLEKANMIKGMMNHNGEALNPIYSIIKDKKIPDKKKEDRGIFVLDVLRNIIVLKEEKSTMKKCLKVISPVGLKMLKIL